MSEHENEVSECILAQAARELREAAHDIEQGRFKGPVWVLPEISLLESLKTEVEISDRIHQLNIEYMVRVEARLKVSSDMLDQAHVVRQAANDLETGNIDCDEVRGRTSRFRIRRWV